MTTAEFLLHVAGCVIGAGIILALYRTAEALERVANCAEASDIMNNYRGTEPWKDEGDVY